MARRNSAGVLGAQKGGRGGGRKRVLLALYYYDRLHHVGIARYAAEAGWILLDDDAQTRSLPRRTEPDGIISFHAMSTAYIDFLKGFEGRVPIVDIGEYGHLTSFARVRTDAVGIAQMAVNYFRQRGFQHIGLVDSQSQIRRRDAMQDAAREAGLNFHLLHISDLRERCRSLPLPMGILGVTDGLAVRAMAILEEAGLLVPQQVAMMGVDNDPCRCLPAPVPLSSIDPDMEQVGYQAAVLLGRLMKGQPVPKEPIDIPPLGIVERESTNILAVDDLEVASALRFIFQNYQTAISVGDVGEQAQISLRRLQGRFQAQLGRSILEVINGKRIEHALNVLTTTKKKIRQIAEESGFGDSLRFNRAFRRHQGMSPKKYRAIHGR